MTRKIINVLALIVLAICLISGGCFSPAENNTIKSWQDLLKLSPEKEEIKKENNKEDSVPIKSIEVKESIEIALYFADSDGQSLELEKRTIDKTEGIARRTIEELIKGPCTDGHINVLPEGTRLLDINVKPDGLCIVNMSSEIKNVSNANQEKLVVYAIANTLGQFSAIENVSFMVNGQKTNSIGGFFDIPDLVKPDYKI